MASPIYSVKIVSAQGLDGSTGPLSPPAGYIWILRDLDIYCDAGLSGINCFLIGTAGQAIFYNGFAPGDRGVAQWRGRQVIPEGETCSCETDGGAADFSLSGYLLSV